MSWVSLTIDQIKANIPYACVGGPFGSELTTRDYVDEGIPVIRGGNLSDDSGFIDSGFVFVSDEKANALSSNLGFPGDIVFTQRGTLGQVGLIPLNAAHTRYVISQSQMKLTVNKDIAFPEYVFWWFRQPQIIELVKRRAITSGVPHINLGILKSLIIKFPSLTEQRKILAHLGAISELIENNRRRIVLLEQSARFLYQEWFVHLRFPGHEHVKVVAGVPEGWKRKPLGDLLTLQRGFDLPAVKRIDGEFPIYAATGIHGYHTKAMVSGPGVVTGRSGSLGSVLYSPTDFWPLNTTLWVKEFKSVTPEFAFFQLSGLNLEQFNGGVAVPTLNRNDVHRIEVALPPKQLMDEFNEIAIAQLQQIEKLTQYNAKLREARDLLLPRLMSGDIAV